MVVVRAKTISIGRFFEFDVPPGFRAYRWPYSVSQYGLRSLTSLDYSFTVDCVAPGLKDVVGPVDEEKQYQRWAEIFGDSASPEDVVVRPFGPDPGACTLPCSTVEILSLPETYFCGAVVRNAGGVLAIYGSAKSADIVTTLRWLLKTLRTPAPSSVGGSAKGSRRRTGA